VISPACSVVVAGIGSEYRRDDGAGVAVARALAASSSAICDVGPLGEPLDLLGRWDRATLAIVVDAVRSADAPGTVRVIELDAATPDERAPVRRVARGTSSTHGIGLAGVLRLARAVGSAPGRVIVVGVTGASFGAGVGLSPAVERAVPAAAALVLELVEGAG